MVVPKQKRGGPSLRERTPNFSLQPALSILIFPTSGWSTVASEMDPQIIGTHSQLGS